MLLAIDAGNSFVKLGWHDGIDWQDIRRVPSGQFSRSVLTLQTMPNPDAIVVTNVAGNAVERAVQGVLHEWRKDAHWVVPQSEGYGVRNGYASPAQLGSDRWAALIGARAATQSDVLVVSVGTAVTIDYMTRDGYFPGGAILPGAELMRNALAQGTAGVGSLVGGHYASCADNTADGVYTGVLLAIAGAIEKAMRVMPAQGMTPELVLTGGGADVVAARIQPACRIAPNLVLDGLLHIARAERMI